MREKDSDRSRSLYYSGANAQRIPPLHTPKYTYQPSILSEALVRLQQEIEKKHTNIEAVLNGTINGIFHTERTLERVAEWTRHDAPLLVVPGLQTAAVSVLFFKAHQQSRGVLGRIAISSVSTFFASLIFFPGLRSKIAIGVKLPLINEYSALLVDGIVSVWNGIDNTKAKLKDRIDNIKRNIRS